MRDKKLVYTLIIVFLFAFGVILWYFFKAKTVANPTINTPTNPFGIITGRTPGSEFVNASGTPTSTTNETEITPLEERPLIQLWNKPVAGYAFVTRDVLVETSATSTTLGTSTPKKITKQTKKTLEYVLFVDRLTGHIYGHGLSDHKTFQITNTTLVGVYDAYITGNGSKVSVRSLDRDRVTIHTTTATIPAFIAGLQPQPLTNSIALQDGITSFAVSNSSNSYSYLVPSTLGSTIYTTSAKGSVSLSSSPFREWALAYGGESLYATTKPSAFVEGQTLALPGKQYVLGGKTGLSSLPNPTGSDVLASMWSTSGLTTFLFSRKSAEASVVNIKTLANKCVWLDSTDALCGVPLNLPEDVGQGLPDDWFQGSVSFSDDFYGVYTSGSAWITTPSASLLFSLHEQDGGPFDVIRLASNPQASALLFTNKRDGTLWYANLSRIIRRE